MLDDMATLADFRSDHLMVTRSVAPMAIKASQRGAQKVRAPNIKAEEGGKLKTNKLKGLI